MVSSIWVIKVFHLKAYLPWANRTHECRNQHTTRKSLFRLGLLVRDLLQPDFCGRWFPFFTRHQYVIRSCPAMGGFFSTLRAVEALSRRSARRWPIRFTPSIPDHTNAENVLAAPLQETERGKGSSLHDDQSHAIRQRSWGHQFATKVPYPVAKIPHKVNISLERTAFV